MGVYRPGLEREGLRQSLDERRTLVIALCAAWCTTCTEFAETFAALAAESSDVTFAWLDIEDDAALAGDVDVENFPTLAIFRDGRLVHFGTTLPQQGVVRRLLGSVSSSSPSIAADDAVSGLHDALVRHAAGAPEGVQRPSNASTN